MNFVAEFRDDGSLLGMNRWDIVTAADWRNQSSYMDRGRTLAPGAPSIGEDPDIWKDRDGNWHMLSHNGARNGSTYDGTGDCGRHFFSATGDAHTWDAAPTSKEKLGGCAYNRTAVFE